MSIWYVVGLVGIGVCMTLISVTVGAYLMYKGRSAVPGERFIGGPPKGQVFTIPEVDGAEEFPEEEKNILRKTEQFLKVLGGK